MAPHAVARDADARRIDLLVKGREDGLGQLRRDVAVHLVVGGPGGGGGVDVEACA